MGHQRRWQLQVQRQKTTPTFRVKAGGSLQRRRQLSASEPKAATEMVPKTSSRKPAVSPSSNAPATCYDHLGFEQFSILRSPASRFGEVRHG